MIIESIELTLFGKMTERKIEFDEGINVIEGENEAGKSTVAAFLQYIFYGVSEGKTGAFYQKYLFLNGGKAEGRLTLSCPQGRFLIARKNDFESGEAEVRIVDLSNDSPIKGTDPAALFLGVDEQTFARTCLLSQLYGHSVSPKELGESVENLLTGADESVNARKAIENLKNESEDLEKNKLPAARKRVASTEKAHQAALSEEDAYEKLTVSYSENLKKAESDRRELAEHQKLVEHADAVHTIERVKRAMAAEEKLNEAEKESNDYRSAQQFEGFLPDKSYIKELSSVVSALERCESALSERQAMLAEKKEQLSALPAPAEGQEGALLADIQACIDRAASFKMYMIVSGVVALSLLMLTVMLFVSKITAGGIVTLILLLAAIAAVGLMYFNYHNAKLKENEMYSSVGAGNKEELSKAVEQQAKLLGQISLLEKESEEEEKAIGKSSQKRAELTEKGSALSEKWGKNATTRQALSALLEEAETVFARSEELAGKEKQARLEYNALKINISEEELKRLFVLVKTDGVEKTPTAEEYKDLTVKVNFYRQTSEALEKKTAQQREQLHKMELTMADSYEIAEKLKEEQEELAALEARAKVVENAILLLEESLAELRAELLPGISKEASAFLKAATGGKYTALTAHDDFTVTVTDQTGGTVPITALSAGMAEIGYMAVRFALSDRIFGERKMPLVLDESFAYLDDLRQAAAFMTIAERVKEEKNQLFFFTCRKRETALFERLATVHKIVL